MDFSPIIEYVEQVLRKEKGIPGCDLKIMRGHETLFRYSSGVSDYEGKKPVSKNDLYAIYSCTKLITCAAALQLIERGLMGLDDPVSRYLPEYEHVFLIKDGEKVKPQTTMTLRHLFIMSAGLDYNRKTQPLQDLLAKNPQVGTVDYINALVLSPLHFDPGERFLYSLCHDVLAAVVEVVSGMRFSQYLEENIFRPLGMKDTCFILPQEKIQRRAALYDCYEPGHIRPFTDYPPSVSVNYESGGGGLYTTVDEYSIFADALANGGVGITGNRILKPETIDLMRSEQLKTYTADENFFCASGGGYGYGLGVRTLVERVDGVRSSVGEFGWDGMAGSYVLVDPKYNLSIFFAMGVINWPRHIGYIHIPIRDLTYDVLGLD